MNELTPSQASWLLVCMNELYVCGGGEADFGELDRDCYDDQSDDENANSSSYLIGCITGLSVGTGLSTHELSSLTRVSAQANDVLTSFLELGTAWNGRLACDGYMLHVLADNEYLRESIPIGKFLDEGHTCCVEETVTPLTAPHVRELLDRLNAADIRIVRDRIG